MKEKKINNNDIVIGIAASGTTPYVIDAIKKCNKSYYNKYPANGTL